MVQLTGGTPVLDRAGGHELDDYRVASALSGLIDGMGHWHSGVLAQLERTGRFLAGTWDPPEGEDGPGTAGEGSWARFIGRIGAVALRAAAESTREERRQRLLALLEIWAASPFADPAARWRTGVVRTGRQGIRDERGAAVCVGWAGEGRRRFLELRTGEARAPVLGEIVEVSDHFPRGWGSPEQVGRLVALIRERGPVPWDPAAAAALREATGMGRAAASLALLGLLTRESIPFLDAGERKILKLKVAEAEDGAAELGRLSSLERLELLADVPPEDPAELWEPEGMRSVAERLAEAWRGRYGRRTVVPRTTFDAVIEREPFRLSAGELCGAFTDPAAERVLRADLDTWLKNSDYGPIVTDARWDIVRFEDILNTVVFHLPWVYAELPAGDVVREGAPELVRLLRERLDHPGLLLGAGPFGRAGEDRAAALYDRFGGRPYVGPERLEVASVDDGLTVGVDRLADRKGYRPPPRLYFRPAFYGDDERSKLLSATVSGVGSEELDAVEWLRSPVCTRIVDRITGAPLPAGGYETNPAASAPEVVSQTAGRLGLDEDPAVLYLQLLALPAPTDRKVRLWNGWSTARHRAACDALLGRRLVVAGKRPRAGRQVFLPGDWGHAVKPYQPMERWKAELLGVRRSYNGRLDNHQPLPSRTLPELFAAAWALVERGEGPS